MFRSTIPAGRWLGLDLRVHMALPALLLVAGAASLLETGAAARGIGLWCGLLFAVLTREGARTLVLLWSGRPPRGIVLFPFGGVVLLSPSPEPNPSSRSLTLVPLLANFGAAALLAAFSASVAPGVRLLAPPWISLHHVLRSAVWTQAILGAVNLLPAASLPSRQLLRSRSPLTSRTAGPAFGMLNALGLLLLLLGFVLLNLWFLTLGCLLLLGAQITGNPLRGTSSALDELATLPVRDVMLPSYATLTGADILSEALESTARSTQEIFPVLQGERVVGTITREAIGRRLRLEGDGYVQRDMQRKVATASPDEPVTEALRRAAALGAGQILLVLDEAARVLGILTPQSLASALQRRRDLPGSQPRPKALARPPVSQSANPSPDPVPPPGSSRP